MARTDDPRYQRSRQALRAAFLQLTHEDLSSVTVSAVCELSGVDRATFYRHVRDVQELAADVIASLAQESAAQWESVSTGSGAQFAEAFALSSHYWEHVADYRALYKQALGPNGSAAAQHAVLDSFTRAVTHELSLVTSVADAATIAPRAHMIAGGVFATLLAWLESDDPHDAADLGTWVVQELTARFSVPRAVPLTAAGHAAAANA